MSKTRLIIGLLLVLIAGLGSWYHFHRPSMLQSLCMAGLPNFSRPAEIDAEKLGCAVVAEKSTYAGVLTTAFEDANFSSSDFPAVAGYDAASNARSWFHCPVSGCGDALNEQLARDYSGECASQRPSFHTGMAAIEAEGWVTVSAGQFGHLGTYPRSFYAARILKTSPPPADLIRNRLKSSGAGESCG